LNKIYYNSLYSLPQYIDIVLAPLLGTSRSEKGHLPWNINLWYLSSIIHFNHLHYNRSKI